MPERAQILFNKYFLVEAVNPTFYQLQAFIRFLGRQVSLMEKCVFLNIDMMKYAEMDVNFRHTIVENFVKLSRNFALQAHVNELDNKHIMLDE